MTTQHNTTQHNTTQHNTTQHNTTQHNTTQHNTTQQLILNTKIKILIIRRAALGDVILITPIIKFLHNNITDIDVVTDYPIVFRNNPYVRNVFKTSEAKFKISDYDRVINLDMSYEKNTQIHPLDAYALTALSQLLPFESKKPELFVSEEDKQLVSHYLSQFKVKPVIIHMRHFQTQISESNSKNIPKEFWLKILTELNKLNIPIIQVGANSDFAVPNQYNIYSAVGQFSIQQLKYLIECSRLMICVDTSTLHIAATTQTPIVSLFTICEPELRKPFHTPFYPVLPEIECTGCYMRAVVPVVGMNCCTKENYDCVNYFSVDAVMEKVYRILSK